MKICYTHDEKDNQFITLSIWVYILVHKWRICAFSTAFVTPQHWISPLGGFITPWRKMVSWMLCWTGPYVPHCHHTSRHHLFCKPFILISWLLWHWTLEHCHLHLTLPQKACMTLSWYLVVQTHSDSVGTQTQTMLTAWTPVTSLVGIASPWVWAWYPGASGSREWLPILHAMLSKSPYMMHEAHFLLSEPTHALWQWHSIWSLRRPCLVLTHQVHQSQISLYPGTVHVLVSCVAPKDNTADILTKPLACVDFHCLRHYLGIHSHKEES